MLACQAAALLISFLGAPWLYPNGDPAAAGHPAIDGARVQEIVEELGLHLPCPDFPKEERRFWGSHSPNGEWFLAGINREFRISIYDPIPRCDSVFAYVLGPSGSVVKLEGVHDARVSDFGVVGASFDAETVFYDASGERIGACRSIFALLRDSCCVIEGFLPGSNRFIRAGIRQRQHEVRNEVLCCRPDGTTAWEFEAPFRIDAVVVDSVGLEICSGWNRVRLGHNGEVLDEFQQRPPANSFGGGMRYLINSNYPMASDRDLRFRSVFNTFAADGSGPLAGERMPMQATKPSPNEIVLTRRFPAPRDSVFAALTEPHHLIHWMKAAGMDLVECEVDLRVGGSLRYVYQRPNGRKIEVHGVFEDVKPPSRLTYVETYDFSPLRVLVTTVLAAHDDETAFRQILRYASEAERDEDYEGVATSAAEAYANLERYLNKSAQ